MFIKSLAALSAAVMAVAVSTSVSAQDRPPPHDRAYQNPDSVTATAPTSRGDASRLSRSATSASRNPNRNQETTPAAATPEQNMAAAQQIATAAGVACQVTQANLLGMTADL